MKYRSENYYLRCALATGYIALIGLNVFLWVCLQERSERIIRLNAAVTEFELRQEFNELVWRTELRNMTFNELIDRLDDKSDTR